MLTDDEFWNKLTKLPLAADKDRMLGRWWPHRKFPKKHYRKVHVDGLEVAREYWYEIDYAPIPNKYWNLYTEVDVWKRRRPNPSGVYASSRMHRLDLTPPRFRDIQWAAEHIGAYKSTRVMWPEIAGKLGLDFKDLDHLMSRKIGSDEKFFQIIKIWASKGDVYMDELVTAVFELKIYNVAMFLANLRFKFLFRDHKNQTDDPIAASRLVQRKRSLRLSRALNIRQKLNLANS